MENTYVPPEVLAQAAAGDGDSADTGEQDDPATASNSPSAHTPMQLPGSGNPNDPHQGQNPFGGQQQSQTLGFKEQAKELKPEAVFNSVFSQLFGEKSDQQKQKEQEALTKLESAIRRSQEEWQAYQERKKQENAQIVQEILEMKTQLSTIAGKKANSIAHSATTGADLSERSLVEKAMKAAQEEHKRQEAAKHSNVPKSPRKGPQAEGPEGGAAKGSMVDRMQSGNEHPRGNIDKRDQNQRVLEHTMGE